MNFISPVVLNMAKVEEHIKLSQEGYDKLKAELVQLRSEGRAQIAAKLEEARAFGDLSENAEYHAAKEEQEKIEGRILQLEAQLAKAVVIDTQEIDISKVSLGTTVTFEEKKQSYTYQIVATEEADIKATPPKISKDSPVGSALLGNAVKNTVAVRTPRGIRKLKITKIEK